jgi:hypothetical protein
MSFGSVVMAVTVTMTVRMRVVVRMDVTATRDGGADAGIFFELLHAANVQCP